MIVLDASVVVLALRQPGDARAMLVRVDVAIPHLADSEIAHALRTQVRRGDLTSRAGGDALRRWAAMGVQRHGTVALLDRIWELRDNVTAYDAAYVALAEALECELVTADARLARASGPRCPITALTT